MNSRDARVDIVKSIGIILVVLGHTQMALCSFVNLFHVGLFFIASGFCFQEKYTDSLMNVKDFFLKRIKRLYVPFVLWNLFYLCFRNLFCTLGIYSSDSLSVQELLNQGKGIAVMYAGEQLAGACWFIRALFILEILFVVVDYILKKICKKYIRLFRAVFAIAMLWVGAWLSAQKLVLPYNISTVFSVVVLFVIGMEFRKVISKDRFKLNSLYLIVGECVIGLIILIGLLQFGTISYDSNNYPNVAFFIVAALAGWMLCWGIAEFVDKYVPILQRGLTYIGKRTMSILFLHLFCFKLPTLIIVLENGLTMDNLSAFPVLDNRWWVLYLLCGIGIPLILNAVFEKICSLLGKKWKFVLGCIIVILLIFVPNIISKEIQKSRLSAQNEPAEIDYSLVYDKEYYLMINPDVEEAIGTDDAEVLEHFINYGMKEGRVASESFDVHYYRDKNGDLGEAFGEELEKYYIHYMQFGYYEGRQGSDNYIEEIYECELTANAADNANEVILNVNAVDESLNGAEIYLFSMPAYSYEVEGLDPIYTGKLEENVNILVKLENLNNKYIVAIKDSEGYSYVSNYAYIQNPEDYSTNDVALPEPKTKKGLQISNSLIEDAEQLNLSYAFTNLVIENIMYPGKADSNVIPYEYKGRVYYFREDEILKCDDLFSRLTKEDVVVTASVISIKSEGFTELYYPEISMDTHAAYYALNTTDEVGTNYVEAFVTFMSERYNGSDENCGVIANWVVGNEVNESGTYNYMGEKEIGDYLEEYTRTFRIIYNIVKTNIPEANVYVPMEPWWGIDSDTLTYGGREFLDRLNIKMKQEGNIDWGVAYHAYSFPLSDPKVLNDVDRTVDETGELTLEGYVTTDSINSVTITMENIEVLTNYMHEEKFLNADGEVRSIILSEQGYTSNSNLYGKCEAQQSASMVYAYYKAQMNDDIDAFIYFVQRDSAGASLNNDYYQFGLWGEKEDGTLEKKMSHEIFQIMDTKESVSELDYMKEILGIESWESVIPNFNQEIFEEFESIQDLNMDMLSRYNSEKSMKDAEIEIVTPVTYSGTECLPEVTVVYDDKELVNDVDYDVVYLNNDQQGQAVAVVVGLGEYTDIKEVAFTIVE